MRQTCKTGSKNILQNIHGIVSIIEKSSKGQWSHCQWLVLIHLWSIFDMGGNEELGWFKVWMDVEMGTDVKTHLFLPCVWAAPSWTLSTRDTAPGGTVVSWHRRTQYRHRAVMSFLFWGSHLTPAGVTSVIHRSSDCKSKEGESEGRDRDHNPSVASDVPERL